MKNRMQERHLIEQAKEGNIESFETLILSCKSKAYNIALRYMKNEQDALDALQDSFIKIYRHLGKFNGESSFDTWVYRIVVNACNDMLKKNKNVISLDEGFSGEGEELAPLEIQDSAPLPDQALESKEEQSYILRCMDSLSAEHKSVIILRDIKGFSYDEICQILDISPGTIKSRLSRARIKLREIYLENLT